MNLKTAEAADGACRAVAGFANTVQNFQAIVGLGGNSIGKDAAMRPGQDSSQQRIVDAGGHSSVEGYLVHEREEGGFDVGHVAVAVHVFAVEIGDDGQDGRELEEG